MAKGKDKRKPDAKKRPKAKDEPRGMFEPPKGKRKKVPIISISVGMAEMKKDPSKKAKMMRGGSANKKEHMYSNGGSVTDKLNPGLRALQKERPDVVANILKKS